VREERGPEECVAEEVAAALAFALRDAAACERGARLRARDLMRLLARWFSVTPRLLECGVRARGLILAAMPLAASNIANPTKNTTRKKQTLNFTYRPRGYSAN
jgi:hypothetical protein